MGLNCQAELHLDELSQVPHRCASGIHGKRAQRMHRRRRTSIFSSVKTAADCASSDHALRMSSDGASWTMATTRRPKRDWHKCMPQKAKISCWADQIRGWVGRDISTQTKDGHD